MEDILLRVTSGGARLDKSVLFPNEDLTNVAELYPSQQIVATEPVIGAKTGASP